MKLLTKSTLYFIFSSLFVFIISGIAIYFMLKLFIIEEGDEVLSDKKREITWELQQVKKFENFILPTDNSITLNPAKNTILNKKVFGDTLFFNQREQEFVPYRYIQFNMFLDGEARQVTIFQSKIKNDDLVEAIIYSLLVIVFFMLVAIILLNYFGMRRFWQPFHKILRQIKYFDFKKNHAFKEVDTNTTEFKDLNSELIKMTQKLTHDYFALKEFSENASHEMQTPLAIIQSKLELVFQQKNIDDETLKSINSAYQATNRLAHLHSDLNLLTRIENLEFNNTQQFSLKKIVEDQIENFEEILGFKKLVIITSLNADPQINGNLFLIEILLSNLFSNAIKHNFQHGEINVFLSQTQLIISNTGQEPVIPTDAMFERFRKGKTGHGSTGLGLALVKQICSVLDFKITYNFTHKLHTVTLFLTP